MGPRTKCSTRETFPYSPKFGDRFAGGERVRLDIVGYEATTFQEYTGRQARHQRSRDQLGAMPSTLNHNELLQTHSPRTAGATRVHTCTGKNTADIPQFRESALCSSTEGRMRMKMVLPHTHVLRSLTSDIPDSHPYSDGHIPVAARTSSVEALTRRSTVRLSPIRESLVSGANYPQPRPCATNPPQTPSRKNGQVYQVVYTHLGHGLPRKLDRRHPRTYIACSASASVTLVSI
jgi:hypothetical protein